MWLVHCRTKQKAYVHSDSNIAFNQVSFLGDNDIPATSLKLAAKKIIFFLPWGHSCSKVIITQAELFTGATFRASDNHQVRFSDIPCTLQWLAPCTELQATLDDKYHAYLKHDKPYKRHTKLLRALLSL